MWRDIDSENWHRYMIFELTSTYPCSYMNPLQKTREILASFSAI